MNNRYNQDTIDDIYEDLDEYTKDQWVEIEKKDSKIKGICWWVRRKLDKTAPGNLESESSFDAIINTWKAIWWKFSSLLGKWLEERAESKSWIKSDLYNNKSYKFFTDSILVKVPGVLSKMTTYNKIRKMNTWWNTTWNAEQEWEAQSWWKDKGDNRRGDENQQQNTEILKQVLSSDLESKKAKQLVEFFDWIMVEMLNDESLTRDDFDNKIKLLKISYPSFLSDNGYNITDIQDNLFWIVEDVRLKRKKRRFENESNKINKEIEDLEFQIEVESDSARRRVRSDYLENIKLLWENWSWKKDLGFLAEELKDYKKQKNKLNESYISDFPEEKEDDENAKGSFSEGDVDIELDTPDSEKRHKEQEI